jgi:dGTPase
MTKRMEWEKLLSTKRVSQFDTCGTQSKPSQFEDPRHHFERDCDQIIFSYPFRRLQDKTQVIPFPEYDFVHTRLTHSLEVASVGRSLGKLASDLIFPELKKEFINAQQLCKSDIGALVAGACLAHDIGNPPFGHSGEDSISFYFKQHPTYVAPPYSLNGLASEDEENYYFKGYSYDGTDKIEAYNKEAFIMSLKYHTDLSKFEGNANGFRILTQNCDRGINPTAALLGTFTKYPRESHICQNPYEGANTPKGFSKYGVFQSERLIFEQLANELGLIRVDGLSKYDIDFHRHPLCFLMEASDDIAYGIIDFEDGCRLGIIDFEKEYKKLKILNKKSKYEEVEINASPLQILVNIASIDNSFDIARVQNAADFKQAISYLRAKVVNVLINECFQIFKNNYEKIMTGNYSKALIEDITNETINSSLIKMKALVRKYVYNYTPVLQSEASGFEVMSKLIESFAISTDICFSCGDSETEKSKKLSSLLPEEYRPTVEKELKNLTQDEIYERLMKVMDYVSGMTDNYATSVYRKIRGIT